MKLRRQAALGITAMLTFCLGCATSYHQANFWSGGYRDEQLDANTFRVSFSGNSSTRRNTVERYLLYRCAELTANAGFNYFIIVGGNTERSEFTSSAPGMYQSTTTGYVTGSGNAASGQAQTMGTYYPGVTTTAVSYGSFAIIKTFKGTKPADNPNAYDARELMQFIGPKIQR